MHLCIAVKNTVHQHVYLNKAKRVLFLQIFKEFGEIGLDIYLAGCQGE